MSCLFCNASLCEGRPCIHENAFGGRNMCTFADDVVKATVSAGGALMSETTYSMREDKSLCKIAELIYKDNTLAQKNEFHLNGRLKLSEKYERGLLHGVRRLITTDRIIKQRYLHGVIQSERNIIKFSDTGSVSCVIDRYFIGGIEVYHSDYLKYQILLEHFPVNICDIIFSHIIR